MLRLSIADGRLSLPLCDAMLTDLAAALAAKDTHKREEMLRTALDYDPSLALWTVCHASSDFVPDGGIPSLSQWLARQGIGEIRRQLTRQSPALQDSPIEQINAWADLAARGVGSAVMAAQLTDQSGHHPRACLLGLLHAAPAWLASGAVDFEENEARAVLPLWLQDDLTALDAALRATSDGGYPAAVARAIKATTELTCGGEDLASKSVWQAADNARQRWLSRIPVAYNLLLSVASMLDRLEPLEQNFDQAVEAAKIESLKELAYGAGHEINNPLANISARAQTLLRDEHDPERRRKLAAINTQAFRAHEMIADMMLFARPPRPEFTRFDLAGLVRSVVQGMTAGATLQHTELHCDADAPLTIEADQAQVAMAVRALCGNALEALAHGGRVDVRVRQVLHEQLVRENGSPDASTGCAGVAQVVVADNGPGLSQATQQHLFDPFYCGREAGRGLGLGLSKCWRIAQAHRGHIHAESKPGQGTRFTLTLPLNGAPVS